MGKRGCEWWKRLVHVLLGLGWSEHAALRGLRRVCAVAWLCECTLVLFPLCHPIQCESPLATICAGRHTPHSRSLLSFFVLLPQRQDQMIGQDLKNCRILSTLPQYTLLPSLLLTN